MKLVLVIFIVVLSLTSADAQRSDQSKSGSQKLPSLKWKFKIGQAFIASPVVDNNVVFIGGLDSILYALDLPTGKIRWKFHCRGPIRSAATVSNDYLFLCGGDGFIYGLDKNSGKRLWAFSTMGGILGERRYDAADYFDSRPVVSGENVYCGGGDGRLYAIQASTGKMIWNFRADDIIHTTPVIATDRIIFGSSDGNVYSINQADGRLLWKFKSVGHRNFPKGEMQGSPVVSGNLVFIGSRDYNLYALDVTSGYGHWNKQFPMGWATALTATDTALFVGTSDDRLLLCVDPRSGRELWRLNAGFNIFGPPAIFEDNVYVGTQMGKLFEVDRKSGKINWTFTTEGYQLNRLNYFKADDSFRDDLQTRVRSFDSYIKMLYSIGAIYSTPFITPGEIVFSSSEGILYCLKK
jgi:eukaryotic-like serine/threonine-protein kinase